MQNKTPFLIAAVVFIAILLIYLFSPEIDSPELVVTGSREQMYEQGYAFANENNYSVAFTSGFSMTPTYDHGQFAVYDSDFPYENLKKYDVVLFTMNGISAMHRLMYQEGDSWVAKGDGNEFFDSVRVSKDNYLGKLIKVFAP